jgi:RNA polymerase sigma factor (sigma-70 family)
MAGRVGESLTGRSVAEASANSEEDLLKAAVSGNRDALEKLLGYYHPVLCARLRDSIGRRYRSAIDLDDTLQVTYIEAFIHIGSFRPAAPSSFLAWLTAIAKHNIQDAIRGLNEPMRPPRGKRIESSFSDESYVVLLASLDRSASTPSRHLSNAEARDRLEAYIEKLPPDYQTVVRLYDLQGLTAREVAAAIGKSVGGVYMMNARAVEKLRALMGTGSTFFSK